MTLQIRNAGSEPRTGCLGEESIDAERECVMQAVALHTAMFEKLLFQGDDLPLSLAELFEDVANTYLTFSESISRIHVARRSGVQYGSNAGVEWAR